MLQSWLQQENPTQGMEEDEDDEDDEDDDDDDDDDDVSQTDLPASDWWRRAASPQTDFTGNVSKY